MIKQHQKQHRMMTDNQNIQKFVIYPYQLVQTDKKLDQAQRLLLKIIQQSYEKQIRDKGDSEGVEEQKKINLNQGRYLYHQVKEDELVRKNLSYIEKCRIFYQTKLAQERNRYQQIIAEKQQQVRNLGEQLLNKQQQVQKYEKLSHLNKQQLKRIHKQSQQIKNKRSMQKQRITQMFIKQKQQLFNKYSNMQRQSMILLEFLNKIEDITQRKVDDQSNKLAFIQQVQLEAANYYSNLSIPLIQEILNTFTQDFNYLYNKFQKMDRNDSKSRTKDHSNQKPSKISLKKLKQYKNQNPNTSINPQSHQLANLKQQLSSIQKKLQEDTKQLQQVIEHERENNKNLKKKIQKYEIQIRKNNKEIEYHFERQEDLKKKINRLQKQILDYKSKVKIQDEEIEVYENNRGQSLPNIDIQSQRQSKIGNNRQVNKQQKESQTISQQQDNEQPSRLKQEIQNLTKTMKDKLEEKSLQVQKNLKYIQKMVNLNEIKLRQKQQQLANMRKIMNVKQTQIMWLQERLAKINNQLSTKSNQIQENRIAATKLQQQLKKVQQQCAEIKQQNISLNKNISLIQNNQYEVEQLSAELNTKCERIRALQQRIEQYKLIQDRYQKQLIRDSEQESMKDKQIMKLREQISKYTKQVREIKEKQINKQFKQQKQKQVAKQKEKKLEQDKQKQKQLHENTSSLQKQVFELITKLEQKTKGYNHFKTQNQKCEKQIIHLQNKYKALKQKYSQAQKHLQSTSMTISYAHEQIQTEIIHADTSQIYKLANKIEQLQKIIEQNSRTIERDNIILQQNQQELQSKQKQLQILQQQLVAKQQEMREMMTKSKEEQDKNRNMHILQIQKQLQNKINAINEQSHAFQHKYHQVINELTQNKTVLTAKLQECDTLQSEVLRLGQMLNLKTKQNQEMRAKLDNIQNINAKNNTKKEQIKVNAAKQIEQIQLIKQLQQEQIIKQDRLTHIQQQYRNLNEILIQKDQSLRITQHKFQQISDKLKKQNQQLLSSKTKMQEFIKSKQQENVQLKQTINSLLKQRDIIQSYSQSVQVNANMIIQESKQKKQEIKQQIQQKDKQKPYQNDNQNNLNTTEMEISQNMISSKQLNMMQQEISNFKQQLNGLMATIQAKDDTIIQLKKQLADLSPVLLVNKKGEENRHSSSQNSPATINKTARQQKMQSQISKLTEKLIEKQNQLQKANIKNTKQQILTSKISELQKKLDSEKQLYQNQINKYNIRIIELQNEVRKQKQEYDSRKRKVFSEEYYSIDPKINMFQSKPKTNEEVSNNFNVPQNQTEQNKSQDYHSIEDDSHEDNKLKTQEQIQLEQKHQNKTQTKIRKQKSQEYERRKSGITKLQKLASIERRYDSDQKSKEQKDMKALMAMRSQQQSPIINSSLQNKLINNLKNQKQTARHHPISNDDAHHYCPVSEYGLNEVMRNLTEQNRQLKFINEKLTKDLKNLLQFVEILSKRWKNHKEMENNSQAGKMIALERLQQNIKLLEISKVKILQEFNPHDLQNIFDNITQLVNETKRWINIIEKLITQNKKMNLQMILNKNFPKLVKTKTNKYGVGEQNHRRSRSVYSQGNVYRQHHIDMDQSPFQIQQQHPQPQHHVQHLQPNNSHQQTMTNIPTSSLEILFRQNNEMSEISSVKHKSFNSGFLNSKSQIAKMFQKGEKFGIEHRDQKKDNQIKRDIVDEYLIQNQKIQKIDKQKQKIEKQRQKFQKQKFDKNKNNNVSTIQNISSSTNKVYQSRIHSSAWQNSPLMHKTNQLQAKRIHKFEQKSNKAKTDFLIMLYNKLEMAKKQVQNNKKQYTQFIKGLIQKNEMKVLATKNQFQQVMKKMITSHCIVNQNNKVIKDTMENNGEIFKKPTSKGNIGRISQKDEQMYEKLEQMQQKIENKKKQIEEKQNIILEGRELIKELEKKLKQEKASHQSTKKKYASQATNSNFLKMKIQKLQTDFKKFMTKASNAGLQNFTILKSEAEAQANIFKDETQPIEKGKTFLKGKKIAKAQTLPEKQQNKINLLNSINKTFSIQKNQDQSIVQNYNVNNGEIFLSNSNTKERIKEGDQSPKKDKQKGKDSIWVNQNYQLQQPLFKRSSSLVYSPQKQERTQQQFQQLIKIKQKKEEQLQLSSIQRIKSQDMRQSKSPPSDIKLLNPTDRNTIKRKKTISQASQKQKVIHYQKQLKQLYILLKQALEDTPIKWIEIKQKQQQDNKSQKSQNESKKNGQNGIRAKKNSQQQIEQEKSIKFEQQIRKIIKDLNEKLKEYKSDMEKSVKQREQKLKDIFKQIIETYKISLRTINKMIDKKVSGDNIYINQRLFFKNLFTQIKSVKAQRWSITDNTQEDQESKFETFEDKYKTLVEENTRIKKELQQRSKQCQNLKKQANSEDNRKYLSHKSLMSNQNQQNFHDFQNKELFDNTKPSFQLLQQLRRELNMYKKKCQEYETINSKKKKQNFKVIRKWQ